MTDDSTALYTAWLNVVPQAFRALVPEASGVQPPVDESAGRSTAPPAAGPLGEAFEVLQRTLTQVYQGYLSQLASGGLSAESLQALGDSGTAAFDKLLAATSFPSAGRTAAEASMQQIPLGEPWASLMKSLSPGAQGAGAGTSTLQLGMERTFGGLTDAFGLRPMRNLEDAWREVLAAAGARQRAVVEYLALVVQAWSRGTTGLVKELQAMAARGERVESLVAFLRLWARAIDAPMHETMQSKRGLEVTAKLINAATRQRRELQRTVTLASEALHMPTRADLDAAYGEIQELKRELRRVRKALPVAARSRAPGGTREAAA
jgi:class III poly(R)-hydroxyalkanoic acid synthase PhaE subunit